MVLKSSEVMVLMGVLLFTVVLPLSAVTPAAPKEKPTVYSQAEEELVARRGSTRRVWLKRQQKEVLEGATVASNVSWIFLASSVVSLPVMLTVNPFAGAILSICSLGGWTISHLFAFFPYGEAAQMFKYNSHATRFKSDAGTMTAMIGHVTGYLGGLFALTFSSLAMSMPSVGMIVITATCATLSWIGGIVGNIGTYVHGSAYLTSNRRLSPAGPSFTMRELERVCRYGSPNKTPEKTYRTPVLSFRF